MQPAADVRPAVAGIGRVIVDDGLPAELLKTIVLAGVKMHIVVQIGNWCPQKQNHPEDMGLRHAK